MTRERPPSETLIEVLQRHAAARPDAVAYTFLADGESERIDITYAGLDRRARSVAAHLQSLAAQGERALLLCSQSLDYLIAFWGCLYAQVIAIPLYVPTPRPRSIARIQAIAEDADCRLLLSTGLTISSKRPVFERLSGLRGLQLVATDTIGDDAADAWRRPAAGAETLAYLQYTSGSTAQPKGVMISHGNLLHNLAFMYRSYGVGDDSVFVSWAPFFHDMGLIMGTLLPLYGRFPCVFMSPAAFAQRPLRWLLALTRHGGTISFGSNFAFDLCADRITPAERATLDLSRWAVAINGAEPVRTQTLQRFAEAFSACGFREQAFHPGYGLAEATLAVSCGRSSAGTGVKTLTVSRAALEQGRIVDMPAGAAGSQSIVGCGATYPDEKVLIVDPQSLTACAHDRVGEIWVAGASAAKGYWKRSTETAETFQARLSDTGEGPFLRTGDLGFMRDGELYVTGRLKDLIIIRGRNIYPQDVEATVEQCHPAMRRGCGAAFAVEAPEGEDLVVVQEIERGHEANAAAIAATARRAIAEEHEVQPYAIVLVKLGSIAKTSSGKIQRRACREAYCSGMLDRCDN